MSTSATTLDAIRRRLRTELPRLRREYRLRDLEVFGSWVRDEVHADSDLDLLVTFDETPTLFRFVELENELADLLGIRVDLVMRDGLKPALGERILAEAVSV